MKAILITPSDVPKLIETDGELESLQELVGGYIEMIRLPRGAVAYVDEEANVKANPPPINGIATDLARASIGPTEYIRGPMVILSGFNAEGHYDGEEHDVPDFLIKALIPGAKS